MKITRGQLRALVDRTEGFVDELECDLAQIELSGVVVLRFHHLIVAASADGSYEVRGSQNEIVAEGAVEPHTNEDWFDVPRFRKNTI